MPFAAANNGRAARKHPRRYIRGQAITHFGGRSTYAQVIQIGEGGMLVATPIDIGVGKIMTVDFVLPQGKLRMKCEILYVVPTPPGLSGTCAGVRFSGASEEERAIIRAFVQLSMAKALPRLRSR